MSEIVERSNKDFNKDNQTKPGNHPSVNHISKPEKFLSNAFQKVINHSLSPFEGVAKTPCTFLYYLINILFSAIAYYFFQIVSTVFNHIFIAVSPVYTIINVCYHMPPVGNGTSLNN